MIALARIQTGGRRIGKIVVLIGIGVLALPIAVAMLVASCLKDGR